MDFLRERPTAKQISLWKKLSKVKYRRKEGLFIAEGIKVVEELCKSNWQVESLLFLSGKINFEDKVNFLKEVSVPKYTVGEKEWKLLSQDKSPEGIMAVVRRSVEVPEKPLWKRGEHAVMLYQIRDPNNLGAIMRSMDWFGIRNLFISKESVDFTSPKVVRTSMGSLFHLRIVDEVDPFYVIREFKKNGTVIVTDVTSGLPPHVEEKPTLLVFGSESRGLPAEIKTLADECWCIPGEGRAESLSLPQAVAIILYVISGIGGTK
ncbi:MAG: RNA methyltransferase [Syntrophales bacterium]|nr:RNA methyltransferase [Syntrophales bacterium]